ncbi:thiaminase II [Sediminicola luteus]|uniref:Aminopyrimidine aminohydrolase n=1 Tax=Sediminicola luteus TaxID=319238 RepID=A0A2A4G4I1_9FLAO|nr:thiaminase II [Sediminicola luteus]PCE62888.1 thiaminase II [Sediminicola luteus]
MDWYTQIRPKIQPIFDQIIAHPFIEGLLSGELPMEVFYFYLHQDSLYLSEYRRTLATIGSQCTDMEESQFYLEAANGVILVEKALHTTYLEKARIESPISPTCELYTSYLSKMVHTQSLAVGMAAVLPCFTIYKEVGDYILAQKDGPENNPFQDWINTYGGEAFAESVAQAVRITNTHAQTAPEAELAQMEAAFIKASQLEWLFWDSAYRQEKWPV